VAPAPLVPLLTPGTYVAQALDAAALASAAKRDGPVVMALVPADVARFVHDPAGGARLCDRLAVQHVPAERPRRAIGRYAPSQQQEQLAQLRALAGAVEAEVRQAAETAIETTRAVVSVASSAGDGRAVDALAGWLLGQAGFAPASAEAAG
jgi:hypothetical protein